MDTPFANLSAFPQGMDFLKQMWAQGLAAQSAMPGMAASGVATSAANPVPPTTAASTGGAGMTQAFQQTMASYLMPTFDVVELDKRINDMRTVLQFMDLNTNMLRQSLQALEVQRNTIAALHGMMQPASTNNATSPQTSTTASTAAPASKKPARKTSR